jgi:phosphoenolpyruvate-protein phosphotransferase (PTS system enzyme I)
MTSATPAIELEGFSLAPGIAIGKAFSFKQIDLDATKRLTFHVKDIQAELRRLDTAVRKSREQFISLQTDMKRRKKKEAAQIFFTQALLLDDEEFLLHVKDTITERRLNSEHVLAHHIEQVKTRFLSMDSEVFRIKSLDVQDVFFRLLRNLLEIEHVRASSLRQIDNRVILVADKFLPSDIVLLEKEKLLGIVLEEGCTVSHVAIIAKSLGVPAIINVAGIAAMIRSTTTMIADGFTGKVIINPTQAQAALYKKVKKTKRSVSPASSYPRTCSTKDARRVILQANAASIGEIEEALRNGAEGIGLVRSELFYLSRDTAPTEKEEYAFYRSLIEAAKGRPLTIRLLDIGADKSPPYLSVQDEDCTQLGIKGIRYLLHSPDLFRRHLVSIIRASQIAPIKMLVPFVSLPSEVVQTKKIIADLCAQERIDAASISIGAMIEIPAIALAIEPFAEIVDFFSIGTNDLVQYLFAASRENGDLEAYRTASLPLVITMVRHIVASAERQGKTVSVCGEIASQPKLAAMLVGAGVTNLSLRPEALPSVREEISATRFTDLQKVAADFENGSECSL